MIVRLARRRRSPFGDDTTDPFSYLNLFDDYGASSSPVIDTGPTTQIAVGTATAPNLFGTATSPANPLGLATVGTPDYSGTGFTNLTSATPAPGTIAVDANNNIVDQNGQVIGFVDPTANKVTALSATPASGTKLQTTASPATGAASISANIASAINSLFGTKSTSAAPGTASFGTPILAGIPNQYVIAGGVLVFALMLSQPKGRGR
jgi:hypothetical protein